MRGWAAFVASGLVLACGGESLEGDGAGGVVVAGPTGGTTGSGVGGSLGGSGDPDGGSGGSAETGGATSSGGAAASGGASSGGSETGGSSSGGAATGGSGTGGEANACAGWTSESFAYGECAVVLGYPRTIAAIEGDPFPCGDYVTPAETYCTPRGNSNPAVESRVWWFRPAPGETLTIVRGTWNENFTECSAGPSCGM